MNVDAARRLRTVFGADWLDRARHFTTSLRNAGHDRGGLLLVGTPESEPWHLAAHLHEAAALIDRPELAPVLVRHRVPFGAPAHLSTGLDRLGASGRHETVLVVAEQSAPSALLERLDGARARGATIFALDAQDPELEGLAHEALTVPDRFASASERAPTPVPGLYLPVFETAQHLVSLAAAERPGRGRGRRVGTWPLRRPGSRIG